MESRHPRPVDQWGGYVGLIYWLIKVLLWLARLVLRAAVALIRAAVWLVSAVGVVVLAALIGLGALAGDYIADLWRTIRGALRSPSPWRELPRGLSRMSQRRARGRAASVRIAQLEAAGSVVGVIRELEELRDGKAGDGAIVQAALVLGRLADLRAAPYLVALADHDSEEVRWAAVDSLGDIGAADAAPILAPRLSDPSSLVRMSAAKALGQVGARHEAAALTELLRRDEDRWVRYYAAEALIELGDHSVAGTVASELARAEALPPWARKHELLERWRGLESRLQGAAPAESGGPSLRRATPAPLAEGEEPALQGITPPPEAESGEPSVLPFAVLALGIRAAALVLAALSVWAAWTHAISGLGWLPLWGTIVGMTLFWLAAAIIAPFAAYPFCRLLTLGLAVATLVCFATLQWPAAVTLLAATLLSRAITAAAKGVDETFDASPSQRP